MLDQMGPVDYAPGKALGAPDHPHRGFETVTYLIDGEMEHRDSYGGGGVIRGGDTQWMTAGAGLVHSEMPTEKMMRDGGLLARRAALGEPAAAPTSAPSRATRTSPATSSRCSATTTAPRSCASSRAISRACTVPGNTHTPIVLAHATLAARRAPRARVAA